MATADGLLPNLRLLRRIRVLIVSRDRRFVGLARLLLTREELLVEATSRSGEVLARVREGADVVVVDGSGAPAAAARLVAEIEATCPTVGVVVVAEDREPATAALRPLPKWDSLEELGRQIRLAYLRLDRRSRLAP
jgi:hypothetical protein